MQEKQLLFLKALSETATPSGYELPGQRVVAAYLESSADSIKLDVHGNLICVLNPNAKRRVIIDGHCDEVGFIVQYIDSNGFIYVNAIGGISLDRLGGERVVFYGPQGKVPGVFGRKAIHLMSAAEREKAPSEISEFWVDIGAKNEAEAAELVPLGSCGVVDGKWHELLNGRIASRGFDDKSGVFVVAEAFRILAERRKEGRGPKVGVYCLSATQEENGLIGVRGAAFAIDPHAAIAVDVTGASDFPGSWGEKKSSTVNLGGGPVLVVGPTYDKGLDAVIEKAAKDAGMPLQIQPRNHGANTDAWTIRHVRKGVPVSLISIPLRTGHSAVETLSLDDLEKCALLVADAVCALPEDFDFSPKL